jgi:hypothetical protein
VSKLDVNRMTGWIKGRQGEELSEVLRNSTEPDGRNNGRSDVDDAGTAHAFIAAKEKALYGEHREGPPAREKKKRVRCTDGKAAEGLCVKRGVRVARPLGKEACEELSYAAYVLKTLPQRIQEAIEAGRELGVIPEEGEE